jgi:hypothetical protein
MVRSGSISKISDIERPPTYQVAFLLLTGQTCGEISRFYEHASNELFCREAISSLRDHCCVEIDPTKTTQLDLASSATFQGLNKLFFLLYAIAAVVFGGLESGFTLA